MPFFDRLKAPRSVERGACSHIHALRRNSRVFSPPCGAVRARLHLSEGQGPGVHHEVPVIQQVGEVGLALKLCNSDHVAIVHHVYRVLSFLKLALFYPRTGAKTRAIIAKPHKKDPSLLCYLTIRKAKIFTTKPKSPYPNRLKHPPNNSKTAANPSNQAETQIKEIVSAHIHIRNMHIGEITIQ